MKCLLFVLLTLTSLVCTAEKKTLKLGLALYKTGLESELNTALLSTDYNVELTYLRGYDEKRKAVLQNQFDILEGGFHSFYEYSKRRTPKVLLHAWYFRTYNDDMFHITGNIITHKDNDISLSDIQNMNIYAKSDFSSSGYYLQKLSLNSSGIKFRAPTFTNNTKITIESVANDKNSVGFIPSFESPEKGSDVKVVYQSNPYPSGLIFADSNIPIDVQSIVAETIINHFIKLREEKAKVNRIYVTPLYDNYLEQFSYNVEEFPVWQFASAALGLLTVIILLASLRIYSKYKSEHKKRIDQAAKQIGISELLKETRASLGGHPDLQGYFNDLTESLGDLSNDFHNKPIAQLTQHAEHLLKLILAKINVQFKECGLDEIKSKRGDFNGNLDAFLKFCVEFNKDGSDLRKVMDDREMGAVRKIIHTPGLFKLLYFFRNPSHHNSDFWEPGLLHSHLTVLSSLLLLQCVNDSKVLDS